MALIKSYKFWNTLSKYHKCSASNICTKSFFRSKSSNSKAADPILNETPTKFSESIGGKWQASQSFGHISQSKRPPRMQGPILVICSAVILIYFCVLREENDLDDILRNDILEQIPGLKEKHELHMAKVSEIRKLIQEENHTDKNTR